MNLLKSAMGIACLLGAFQASPEPAPRTWSAVPSGTSRDLYDIAFSGSDAIAVGADGIALLSKDGGKSWEAAKTGYDGILRSVLHAGGHLYAAGDGGTGPRVWTVEQKGNSFTMSRTDELEKWAKENGWTGPFEFPHVMNSENPYSVLLDSADGGRTWKKIKLLTNFMVHSLCAGPAGALRIADSGGREHYDGDVIIVDPAAKKAEIHNFRRALNGICFTDDQNGYAVCSTDGVSVAGSPDPYGGKVGNFAVTKDGGRTWDLIQTPFDGWLLALHSRGALQGWAVGDKGAIVSTEDGGKTWEVRKSGVDVALSSVLMLDDKRGFACGTGGTLVETADGGAMWTPARTGIKAGLHRLVAAPDGTVFAVGDGGTILQGRKP